MTHDPSIADRLAEVAAALRSPLSRDLAGEMTPVGIQTANGLHDLLAELPQVKASTADDALALAVIAGGMLQVVAANAEGNHLALEAVVTLAQSIDALIACLSELSDRPTQDFNAGAAQAATAMQ